MKKTTLYFLLTILISSLVIGFSTNTRTIPIDVINLIGGSLIDINGTLFVDGTKGNVGIGISTPTERLVIIGNLSINYSAGTNPIFFFDSSNGLLTITGGDISVIGGINRILTTNTSRNNTALSVIQAGEGKIAEFKTHLTVGSELSISSEKNELTTILTPTSAFEIRMKGNVTWTARTDWDVEDVGANSAPAFADLDNDGDYDLLIGDNAGVSFGYENTGTVTSPVWTANSDWDTPDSGGTVRPAFADLDNDGDYDLLVGNSNGDGLAYENTGSVTSPVWTARTDWDVEDVGVNSVIAFADLDNDGDYDLIIGQGIDTTRGYENTGSVTSPVWTANTGWDLISSAFTIAPAFADLDNDGDYDLLIGHGSGGVMNAFEHNGSATSPGWIANTDWEIRGLGDNTVPAFADLDNDGDYDLLIGGINGETVAYENTGTNIASLFIGKFGKVGINTTDPKESLHVYGNLNVTVNILVEGCIQHSCDTGCVEVGTCV